MITRPKFKDCFHVEVVEPQYVFLLTENQYWLLNGPLYAALAPYLKDGRYYSANELVSQLAGRYSAPEIYYALSAMEKKGYIVEVDERVPAEKAAFWESLGIGTKTACDRLAQTSVSITSLSELDPTPLREALTANDIRIEDEGDLQIVLVDDYLQEEMAAINEKALASGKPWLPVRLTGLSAWIGPIFTPGKSACWACLGNRIQINRQLESYILRQTGSSTPLKTARAALPSTIQASANLVATEVLKWVLRGKNELLHNQLITYRSAPTKIDKHVVVRRPQCPVCGNPEAYRQMKPVELQSRIPVPGSSRTLRPEETFERYKHHVSDISGIVTWLVDTSGKTDGMMHNYSAGHSFAIARDTLDYLRELLKGRTGGKGRTNSQAKAAAVGEALERYTGVYRGDELMIRGTYRQLGEQAIHVNSCMNFSEKQYTERDTWNTNLKGTRFNVVPERFDHDLEIDWTPLWSLTHEQVKYLPTAFCYYGHPESVKHFFCLCDSNGVAAGNTVEEAILSGLMELVERDGLAMWWYNRLQRPRIDLDSFKQPYLDELQEYYRRKLNRDLWAIDISTDLNIPAFVVLSRRNDRQPEDIIFGSSADLDPVKALLGAAAECNQFLPAIMHKKADGSTDYIVHDPAAVAWWTTATSANQPYLNPNPGLATRSLSDYTALNRGDLKEDILTCRAIMGNLGMEVLVLDQTRPDIALPVCKVLVPGLRHFWRRLGPGRLYDVPVKMGWLEKPYQEEELNPISIFY